MNRFLALAAPLLVTSCMARFAPGPGYDGRKPTHGVIVKARACSTPATLFDCRDAGAVAAYLADYLMLNGLKAAGDPARAATASFEIAEDRGVVSVKLTLATSGGAVLWKAEGQGDTLVRALVRLEKTLDEEAYFHLRLLADGDLARVLKKLGRSEMKAGKNTFSYR